MYTRDDSEYERWRRYGRDRGWMEKTVDEVRSWFGDEEAELRRSYDQMEGSEGYRESEGRYSREPIHRNERAYEHGTEGRYDRGHEMSGRYGRETYGQSTGREFPGTRWTEGKYSEQRRYGSGFGAVERPAWEREQYKPHEYGQRGFGSGSSDSSYEGRYMGRGPKSYRRSDEKLKDEICEHLTRDPRIDATEIDVEVKDCEVTLSGTVDTRYEKRLAEDLAEDIYGVSEVHNNIRVSSLGSLAGNQPQSSLEQQGFGKTGGLGRSGLGEQGPQNRI